MRINLKPFGPDNGGTPVWVLCLLVVIAWCLISAGPAEARPKQAFSFNTVIGLAKDLSTTPFKEPELAEKPLQELTYDQWRSIQFNDDKAVWRSAKLPFEVKFFHTGFLYRSPVTINLVENGKSEELKVTKEFFKYGARRSLADTLPEVIGAAGFRIHGPINTKKYYDEIVVFLGASYFRAVSKGIRYGLSARGVAIDTALPKGEEFPIFKEFWITRPNPGDKEIVVHALLDSVSLTGAYAFKIKPGTETVIDVAAYLFSRKKIEKLGIGPLTSMFLYGENSLPSPRLDWRPEVHDSDGLLTHTADEKWIWRPLQNPRVLTVTPLDAPDVLGFGLLQRDRAFHDYEDLEARYELRPSLWIEPLKNWGEGHVELVEIPTDQEIHDNIVAYWVPKESPEPGGEPLNLEYRMRWGGDIKDLSPGAHVVATRVGHIDKNTYLFVLDFEGDALEQLKPDAELGAEINVSEGAEMLEYQVYANEVTKGWRLAFRVRFPDKSAIERMLPDKAGPVTLEASLRHKKAVLGEIWHYVFKPEPEE